MSWVRRSSSLRSILPAFVLAVGALAAPMAGAGTIKVGTDAATIQAAVTAALANGDANDTVLIPAGIYDETVAITLTGTNAQESLTLKRSGSGTVVVRGLVGQAAFTLSDVHGVALRNLIVQSGTLRGGGVDDDVAAIEVGGDSYDVEFENCIGVATDDVGIDVRGTAVRGVKIKNCNFSGLARVSFRIDGSDHTLESCLANATGRNGYLFAATSENCRMNQCSGLGLLTGSVNDPGYATIRGTGHEIEDCDIGSGLDGWFVAGSGHHLVNCDSTLNAQSALHCDEATDTRFDGCTGTLSLVGFNGGGAGVLLDDCKFSANSSHGVFVTRDRVKVVGCRSDANGGSGIFVLDAVQKVLLRDNKLKSNGGEGIRVEGDLAWVEANTSSNGDGIVDAGTDNAGRDNVAKSGATNDFP